MTDTKGALDSKELEALVLGVGADAVGLADLEAPVLQTEAEVILTALPEARTAVAIVVSINPDNVRSRWMSVMNHEFGAANQRADDVCANICRALVREGVRAVHVPAGFPMDTQKWPDRMWPVSHKLVAEAAGLGVRGHNRNLLHPEYGSHVCLGTVLIDREVSSYGQPLRESPCIHCRMCAEACPTGAVAAGGEFNFINCAVHNYHYRLGGFVDWVENIAEAKGASDYRRRVSDAETVSMWQGLAYGTQYTCCNCIAACPVGVGKLKEPRDALINRLLKRNGHVFVLAGSDAEAHAVEQLDPSYVQVVQGGTRPRDARGFLRALPVVFQPGRSEGLDAIYHFVFTGESPCEGTVEIKGGQLSVQEGLSGTPDLHVQADSVTWLRILSGGANPLWAVLTGKLKLKGPKKLLDGFSRCFPG